MNKSKKTIICIAIAVVVIICAVILKNTVFAPKGAFKEGSSGVIEYSGYNVEGLHYGFNTQQECYLKTDNYNGVKEIDVNFAETAEQDTLMRHGKREQIIAGFLLRTAKNIRVIR